MIDVFKAASLGDLRRPTGGESAGALYGAPIGFETDSDAAITISLRRLLQRALSRSRATRAI
jgi:hypothetical protein